MTIAVPASPSQEEPSRRPWLRALCWLSGLGVLFYTSYPLANYLADRRAFVPSIVFSWERGMPFLPWTIIPYWSINFFYAASLFLCSTRFEVDTLGRRLLTAQVVAISCFILFPLRFSFAKPEIDAGLPGMLFEALLSFDKPYNQAPSLHIALLVILWTHYARYISNRFRGAWHIWCTLIGVSVLTTYQHHFVDIPTGALLGLFCLWLWPDEPGQERVAATQRSKRLKLAGFYALGAVVFAVMGIMSGGWVLWLCYPAVSLVLVATNYIWRGAAGFQKRPNGTMPFADLLLFAPYQFGAFLNSRWWTRRDPAPAMVSENLFLGRIPSIFDRRRQNFDAIVDLCAELPARRDKALIEAIPLLDLVVPEPVTLAKAANSIEAMLQHGTVLVCCALGYSRSAAVVATWLLQSGQAATADEAISIMRAARPRIVLGPDALAAITAAGKAGQLDG